MTTDHADPARTKGLQIDRVFSKEGVHPFDELEWEKRTAEIKGPDGSVVFRQENVEFPKGWSQLSVDVVGQKYFRGPLEGGTDPSKGGRESSVKQLVSRVADTISAWAAEDGYFERLEDKNAFRSELTWLLVNQHAAFNSPVWFNVGLYDKYGWKGSASNWRWDHGKGEAIRCEDSYRWPQGSACFILGVEDSMESILELAFAEGMIFKNGSGAGTDLSTLRSSRERLSAGGRPSGPVSFLKGYDAFAGVIKSGGAVRRSAKMDTLKDWHPDIVEFVECKAKEEEKAKALIRQGYPSDFNGESYSTVAYQNANLSVRVSDAFLEAAENGGTWTTKAVSDGRPIETMSASGLLDKIAKAAWICGDPGVQYHDAIQDWHTCPNSGEVSSSNPCCLTGDTLIAVADGRNAVPIRDLVGQTVNVYSWDHARSRTVISEMNNISVKRRDANVYRITLDDGSSFRSTDDHLIMLRDGTYRQAKDLKTGDSLNPFHSHVPAREKNRTLRRYIHTGTGWKIQYRWIWEHSNGKAPNGYHIHHKDFNSLNDSLDNMTLLTEAEHIDAHRDAMRGDNNPARRCMTDEWRAKLSAATSGENNPNYGKTHSEQTRRKMRVAAAARWSDEEQHKKAVETAKARVAKAKAEGRQMGCKPGPRYEKCCPACRNNFSTPREVQIFCSNECRLSEVGKAMSGKKRGDAQRGKKLPQERIDRIRASRFMEVRPEDKKKAQEASLRSRCLKAARLLMDAGYDFNLDSWDSLKKTGRDLGAYHFPSRESVGKFFASESEFKEQAALYNHKVVSVEFDGVEDVYDGTVPGNHNFAIITSQAPSAAGEDDPNYSGIFVHNSEYLHVNDSACNLASLNLLKFFGENGEFDFDRYRAACRIMFIAQDAIVSRACYPTAKIAENAHKFRQLGLGFSNLGAVLLSLGIPYDSDEGRGIAAGLMAILHGEAYLTSAVMASALGPFEHFELNREPMLRVMHKHADAVDRIEVGKSGIAANLKWLAKRVWDACLVVGSKHGYRNAQATVLAPAGTISFLMGCSTTGIEPTLSLVSYKKLAGGGVLKIATPEVGSALKSLGYDDETISSALEYVKDNDTIDGFPGLRDEHIPVFECSLPSPKGGRSIHWMGHLKMMAACQPFISGAISKSVNCSNETTPEEIRQIYLEGWKLGLKAVAIYRDGSKWSQPLNTKAEDSSHKESNSRHSEPDSSHKPVRERLPDTRQSVTHKFSIAGHEGYLTVGLFPDGRPGELFIVMAKEGSTIGGLMDAFATSVSMGLQHGVPLKALVEKFEHQRFEPSGFTRNADIPMAKSLVDYIFRWLGMEFLPGYREANSPHREDGPREPATAPDAPDAAPQADGPPCGTCHTLTVRCGACYRCPNCGSTTGCG